MNNSNLKNISKMTPLGKLFCSDQNWALIFVLLLFDKYFSKQCFKIIHQLQVSSVSISVIFTPLSFFTKMYYLEDLLAFSSWLIKQVQHMKELFMSRCTSLFSFLLSCIPSQYSQILYELVFFIHMHPKLFIFSNL